MIFLLNWVIFALAIIIAAYLLPGISIDGFFVALITALVLGLINAIIKPILLILTLPINILTFGLFTFVINAFVIILTGWIVPGFHVQGFFWALLFSFVVSILNWVLSDIKQK